MDEGDLWYKDAIFYELHVKAYSDSNADGVGDFRGLTGKLDYLRDLGVDCIWLLPMYPSPFRDDGYDIADYYSIHPSYGSLEDFREFLDAAHARGPARHHRAGAESHLRPAPVVPGGAQLARQPAPRLVRLERHRRRYARRRASSSSTPRRRTGRGIRSRSSTTGTASSAISPISNFDNPGGARRDLERDEVLARAGRRRLPRRRGAVPDRARGHDVREPARDPRGAQVPAPAARRALSRAACCWPKPTCGPRTCGRTSATATSSTWRSTFRSCRACSWRCGWRTASRSSKSSSGRRRSPTPASGACSCATTTS